MRVAKKVKKIILFGSFSESMKTALHESCPEGFELVEMKDNDNLSELAYADYMINRGRPVNENVLDAAPNLKLIQKWGVGYDAIDIKAAGLRNIPVSVCIGGNSVPVAELTVGLILSVLRNIIPLNSQMKLGLWERERYSGRSYLLNGKVVGLIGIGSIARKVAHIVKNGFGAKVCYYDIKKLSGEQERELGVTYDTLERLLSKSDIVSIHVPLLSSTRNLIDKNRIALMKPTACIINTSRGGIVNEDDLIEALKNNRILGAGLDTFDLEPLPLDSELLRLNNVVTTPHCGGNTVDNDINMAEICMNCVSTFDESGDWNIIGIVNNSGL